MWRVSFPCPLHRSLIRRSRFAERIAVPLPVDGKRDRFPAVPARNLLHVRIYTIRNDNMSIFYSNVPEQAVPRQTASGLNHLFFLVKGKTTRDVQANRSGADLKRLFVLDLRLNQDIHPSRASARVVGLSPSFRSQRSCIQLFVPISSINQDPAAGGFFFHHQWHLAHKSLTFTDDHRVFL